MHRLSESSPGCNQKTEKKPGPRAEWIASVNQHLMLRIGRWLKTTMQEWADCGVEARRRSCPRALAKLYEALSSYYPACCPTNDQVAAKCGLGRDTTSKGLRNLWRLGLIWPDSWREDLGWDWFPWERQVRTVARLPFSWHISGGVLMPAELADLRAREQAIRDDPAHPLHHAPRLQTHADDVMRTVQSRYRRISMRSRPLKSGLNTDHAMHGMVGPKNKQREPGKNRIGSEQPAEFEPSTSAVEKGAAPRLGRGLSSGEGSRQTHASRNGDGTQTGPASRGLNEIPCDLFESHPRPEERALMYQLWRLPSPDDRIGQGGKLLQQGEGRINRRNAWRWVIEYKPARIRAALENFERCRAKRPATTRPAPLIRAFLVQGWELPGKRARQAAGGQQGLTRRGGSPPPPTSVGDLIGGILEPLE